MANKTEKRITSLFKDKISFSLNFDSLNKNIDYTSLIEKKNKRTGKIMKNVTTIASFFIVIVSCISLMIVNKIDSNKYVLTEYHKILNSDNFAFYVGPQCPLPESFEEVALSQNSEKKTRSFYKLKLGEISDLFTGAYIPSYYYDRYYNDYAKYVDMEGYLHTNEFFYFYRNRLRTDENAEPIIWRDFIGAESITNTIDNGNYKLVMLLRTKDVEIYSNETRNYEINKTKRLYISTGFRVIDGEVSVYDYGSAQYLINMTGEYLWGAQEKCIEGNDLAITFSTPAYVDFSGRLTEYEGKEVVECPLYKKNYYEDLYFCTKQYYGSYYEDILSTALNDISIENLKYMYCDYNKFSEIVYK